LTTKEASYTGCGCTGSAVTTLTDEGTIVNGVTKKRQQKLYSDSLGRVTKTEQLNWDGAGSFGTGGSVYATTVNSYNARDQVSLVRQFHGSAPTDPNDLSCPTGTCQQTIISYDGYGRLKTKHAPEQDANTATVYDYYQDDTLQKVTDARGKATSYSYNARRLVKEIRYDPHTVADPADVTFVYDEGGNRVTMTDSLGAASYAYDTLSRMTSETRLINGIGTYSLSYSYNVAGALTTLTDPFGAQVGYEYDATGRTTRVTGTGFGNVSTYASNLKYRASGALKSLDYGNTRSLALTYNARLQPATFTVPNVLSKTYDYQPDGRLVFSHDLSNSKFDRSYEYDHAGRITQALSGGEARNEGFTALRPYKQTFSYDPLGHLVERPVNIVWSQNGGGFSPAHQTYQNERNVNWQYDADGRLIHSSDVDYTIDAAGNTSRAVSLTTIPYNGNPYSTITSVTNDLSLSRDGDGAALKQVDVETTHGSEEGDVTTTANIFQVRSSVLGGKVVLENSSETGQRGFVYLGNEVLAWQLGVGATGTVKWEHRDPQNGSFRLTRSTGSIEMSDRAELDPLGTNAGTSDPNTVPSMKLSLYPAFGASQGSSDAQCNLDGMMTPCSRVFHAIGIGAAAPCPNNNCGPRFNPNRDGPGRGGWQPLRLSHQGFSLGSPVSPPKAKSPKLIPHPSTRPAAGPDETENDSDPQNSTLPPLVPPGSFFQNMFNLLESPRCSNFISSLINTARQLTGIKPISYSARELIGIMASQPNGGYLLSGGDPHDRSRYGAGGGGVGGSLASGDLEVDVGLMALQGGNNPSQSFLFDVQIGYAMTGLHETIHLAGGSYDTYTDEVLAKAVFSMFGDANDDPSQVDPKSPRATYGYGKIWDKYLRDYCDPRADHHLR
jgi:YD repeat-containing protein